ncbi:MAG: hypothetical protein M3297_14040 [Thermoproteota archaeon]|jgi:hypothetical protein|nr:hypothetical protein [Thermoproteota archaeon]
MSKADHSAEDEEPIGEFIPLSQKEKCMLTYNLNEEQYNDWIRTELLPTTDGSHLQPIPEKRLRHLYTQQQANQELREQIDNRQMDDYKAHVMLVLNLNTNEEYSNWVLEGNILPLELRRDGMSPTTYRNRVRHALGLTWAQWKQKTDDGELKFWPRENYIDEDPNAVF